MEHILVLLVEYPFECSMSLKLDILGKMFLANPSFNFRARRLHLPAFPAIGRPL